MKNLWVLCAIPLLISCKKDVPIPGYGVEEKPTPLLIETPFGFPQILIPENNPTTVEGVALGRKLFYDPILSGNNTMSCASCHVQNFGFTDNENAQSIGIDGIAGTRNSMPIFNLAWAPALLWDGGAADLESQVLAPITSPIEMHEDLTNALDELNTHNEYPALFEKAFGTKSATSFLLMKAIAQFERTMISADSKYDRYIRGDAQLNEQEIRGMNLFSDMNKGDCNHCHTLGGLFTDFGYRNTGLDLQYSDQGRFLITLNESDKGKFKTPSLRNIALTAPYMHDGRFETLLECVQHYNTGFQQHPNLDPALAFSVQGRLSQTEMEDIVAFLQTLTDSAFIANQAFSAP
jgi:cytochrome c peroxidase